MRKDHQISTMKLINNPKRCLKLKNPKELIGAIDRNSSDSAQVNQIKTTSFRVISVKFPLLLPLKMRSLSSAQSKASSIKIKTLY